MFADLRSAVQQARRHPWYFAGAALSLAIGMAVATAVFGVVDAVLLQPLPFHDSGRLVHVAETVPIVDGSYDNTSILSGHAVAAVGARSFSDAAVITQKGSVRVVDALGHQLLSSDVQLGAAEARTVQGAWVTTNFLRLLGVRPLLGRDFAPHDGLPGAMAVIISHRMWTMQFAADTSVVGREISVAGAPHRVIGVMDEGFDLPRGDIWLPLRFSNIDSAARAEKDNDVPSYRVIARLAPGVDLNTASAELATLYARHYADTWRAARWSRAVPLQEILTANTAQAVPLWSAIAFLVAVLCAVNFATISLARGMRRRAEIAVRAAMGASTAALIRMLVAEALLIACAAGMLALLFATWLLQLAGSWLASGEIVARPITSVTTVGFAVIATIVVGIVFAIAPAVELARVDLRSRLQGGTTQATARRGELRSRRLLVGLQLSLALTAVACVAALVESDRRHWARSVGIDHRNLYTAHVTFDTAAHLVEPLLGRLHAMHGVAGVALRGRSGGVTTWTDDRKADALYSYRTDVSPAFFATLGLPLRAGRVPTEAEASNRTPVVVISSHLARQSFGSDSGALGRRLHIRNALETRPYVVVGVVPDFGGRALSQLSWQIYTMQGRATMHGTIVLRRRGDAASTAREVTRVVESLGPGVTLSGLTHSQRLIDAERGERMGRMLFVLSVGTLALVLAIVGLYGLAAYNTEARAREFGIRIALGARPARLAASLVEELWPMAAIGVVAALAGAAHLTSFFDERFSGPLAEQPLVLLELGPALAAAGALCVVLLIANAVPMRRVLRLDVMRAINSDSAT